MSLHSPSPKQKLHPEEESFLSFVNLVVNTCYNLKPVGEKKTKQKRKDLIDPSIKYDRIFLEPSCFPYTFQFDSVQAEMKSKHELFFLIIILKEMNASLRKNNSFNCHFGHRKAIPLIPQQNASLLK